MSQVRCSNCLAPISALYKAFDAKIATYNAPDGYVKIGEKYSSKYAAAFDALGVMRICCRNSFMNHLDTMNQMAASRHEPEPYPRIIEGERSDVLSWKDAER